MTMEALQAHGYSQHLIAYTPKPGDVMRVVNILSQFVRPHCSYALQQTRITLEAHEQQTHFMTDTLRALRQLRNESLCYRVVPWAR